MPRVMTALKKNNMMMSANYPESAQLTAATLHKSKSRPANSSNRHKSGRVFSGLATNVTTTREALHTRYAMSHL